MLPDLNNVTVAFSLLPSTARYELAMHLLDVRDDANRPDSEREHANAALMVLTDAAKDAHSRERAAFKATLRAV